MVIVSKNLADTSAAARSLLEVIEKNQTHVVALHGDLGSGKTTFTQAVAKELGIIEIVTSPTYVIQKRYELPKQRSNVKNLIHIDAYRLEKSHELVVLGWSGIVSDPSNLIMVEWPERVEGIIPSNALHIYFTFIDETTRKIKF